MSSFCYVDVEDKSVILQRRKLLSGAVRDVWQPSPAAVTIVYPSKLFLPTVAFLKDMRNLSIVLHFRQTYTNVHQRLN